MTTIASGSDMLLFRSRDEIVEHILEKVLANTNRLVGTEWETFWVNSNGLPITRADSQKAFQECARLFKLQGYNVQPVTECSPDVGTIIVGLDIEGLGLLVPEAGLQFEFACSVSKNAEAIQEKNAVVHTVLCDVAKSLGYIPTFTGHVPSYAENTEGSNRNRSICWRRYYQERFGVNASLVREGIEATASTQVTIDAGAEKFHEFFRALLLIEPLLSLHYANSDRSAVSVKSYGRFIPSQVNPIVDVWTATNPKAAIRMIVDRLMTVEVPFLPDPEWSDLYRAEPFINDRPPMVEQLMHTGALSEKTLNNAGRFFYTRPAFKNFPQALLEVRGVDSQPTPERVAELARRVTALVYDDAARAKLLNDYEYLSAFDIQALHDAAAMENRDAALSTKISGKSVADLMADIIARCHDQKANPPMWTAA